MELYKKLPRNERGLVLFSSLPPVVFGLGGCGLLYKQLVDLVIKGDYDGVMAWLKANPDAEGPPCYRVFSETEQEPVPFDYAVRHKHYKIAEQLLTFRGGEWTRWAYRWFAESRDGVYESCLRAISCGSRILDEEIDRRDAMIQAQSLHR
jgi:hypothetical protein